MPSVRQLIMLLETRPGDELVLIDDGSGILSPVTITHPTVLADAIIGPPGTYHLPDPLVNVSETPEHVARYGVMPTVLVVAG